MLFLVNISENRVIFKFIPREIKLQCAVILKKNFQTKTKAKNTLDNIVKRRLFDERKRKDQSWGLHLKMKKNCNLKG